MVRDSMPVRRHHKSLACRRFSGEIRMLRDIKPHNFPPIVAKDDHHVEQPKRRGGHHKF
jgi:hypothetical protein